MPERRVKKPVPMIQCSNPVSLVSRKLFNVLLWRALQDDVSLNKEVYQIDINLLLQYTGTSKNNKDYLVKFLKNTEELQTTLIRWDIKKQKRSGSSQMIGSLDVIGDKVEYSLPYHLRKIIVDSKIFEMIRLNITKLYKSKYALALYENCVRYKKVGSTGWIDVETWKSMLGAKAKKYSETYKFNFLLKKAIDEVNSLSDIVLDKKVKKSGHSITHIKILIEKKGEVENTIDLEDLKQQNMPQMTDDQVERNKQKLKELRSKLHGKEKEEK
jgi:plasmid replication initiation protein